MIPEFCSDPIEPCCDCLHSTVRALVDAAADAVEECIGDPALCKDFGRYVSIGEPQNFGDFVAGWADPILPVQGRSTTPGAKQLITPKMVATIQIRLVEGGFPTLEMAGGRFLKPAFEKLDYTSLHFYSHAEIAWRAMMRNLRPACGRGCETIQYVSQRPIIPQTSWAAWQWTFQATLTL